MTKFANNRLIEGLMNKKTRLSLTSESLVFAFKFIF